jgi:hypothetical protein
VYQKTDGAWPEPPRGGLAWSRTEDEILALKCLQPPTFSARARRRVCRHRRAAEASGSKAGAAVEVRKNVCKHCSVGCTVIAEVENGVWTRQQPAWDSPINRGTHCAKGAAIREVVHGGRRLKYPLKLEGSEWKRISWHQAAPAQGTTWPPAGPPLADVPQQKSGMAAPVPPPESAQKPPFVTRLLERE